jgi:DNA mismatch repair protein MSH5
MASCGIFVPAERATIGVVDRICTRLTTLETAALSLSTFMIDLNQVSNILYHATSSSLVLIDEFGRGTDDMDGMAMFLALLKSLSSYSPFPPLCVISTHFHELFQTQLNVDDDVIQCMQMSILIHEGSDALVPLFKLKPGFSNCSYGIQCATLAGVPAKITERAQDILECLQNGKPIKSRESSTPVDGKVRKLLSLFVAQHDWLSGTI